MNSPRWRYYGGEPPGLAECVCFWIFQGYSTFFHICEVFLLLLRSIHTVRRFSFLFFFSFSREKNAIFCFCFKCSMVGLDIPPHLSKYHSFKLSADKRPVMRAFWTQPCVAVLGWLWVCTWYMIFSCGVIAILGVRGCTCRYDIYWWEFVIPLD